MGASNAAYQSPGRGGHPRARAANAGPDALPRRVAAVVVGAGVVGASVAYHLARRGLREVLVIERAARPGAGSTGVATGGFRAQFGTEVNVRLSLLARARLAELVRETGVDPELVPAGYLWLAESPWALRKLRDALEVQRRAGFEGAAEVSLDEIRRLQPAVALDGVRGGTFAASDGFLRPMKVLEGCLVGARRLGVRVACDVELVGLETTREGRITEVRTSRGRVATDLVVNAAGAWAAAVAERAGLELPVAPLRRQVAVTVPCDLLPAAMPMTIFADDGFHLRVRDGRVLLLQPSPGVPGRPFELGVNPAWIAEVTETARRRVPSLRDVAIDREACASGLYEMSPDGHAILGTLPECPNLWFANGSSGHGVMHAPALGQLLSEMIVDGAATSLDVTTLAPTRFREGKAVASVADPL